MVVKQVIVLVQSVRRCGDGRPAALLPNAARPPSGVLRRGARHLRAVAVRRRLGCARDQRRHVRRVGGNPARGDRVGAAATTARSPIRRCTPCRFTPTSTPRSTTTSGDAPQGQFRPKSVAAAGGRIRELANQRLDELLPRGTFDLTQDYGGIVAASVVCELVGLPVDLAARRARNGQRREPGGTGKRCRGGQRQAGLPGLPHPVVEQVRSGSFRPGRCPSWRTCSPTACPTARR